MRNSLVVFDLDGTLVDSRRDLADSINLTLEAYGLDALSEERVGRMVGDGAAVLVARAFEASRSAVPPEALARFLEIYGGRLLVRTQPYAGVPRVLEALAQDRRLAVLTNKPLAATRQILEGLDLARYFEAEAIVGGDGPHARKPDPSGLRWLMTSASVEPAGTILVGDSAIDQTTARAAGTRLCAARYGFGFDPDAFRMEAGDVGVDAPEELLTVL